MSSVDDILIERAFSPLAGWFQHRCGLDQWRLSLESLNGHLAFYLAGVAFAIAGKGLKDGIFVTLLAALIWLLLMDFVRRRALRQASSSLGVQTARLGEWIFRLVLLTTLPLSACYVEGWSSLCYTLSLAFLVGHLYFKACDSPPPSPRGKLAYQRG